MDQYDDSSAQDGRDGSGNIIDIPLRDDQEVVTLNLTTDLSDDPTELCDLLENEYADKRYWLAIGTAYSRQGKVEEAVEVVNRGLKAPVSAQGSSSDKLPFYSCLVWLYLKLARQAPRSVIDASATPNLKTKQYFLQLATQALNEAVKIDPTWTPNALARCLWASLQPSTDNSLEEQALKGFDDILRASGNTNLIALLGRAQLLYTRKNFKGALRLYQQVLSSNPDMLPDPRIGIGLCFWALGQRERAKAAWQRSLVVHPDNASSKLLLGLYYVRRAFQNPQGDDLANNYRSALVYLQDAYKRGKAMPRAAVALAGYLFAKKDMKSVLRLAEKAVDGTELPSIASEAYFWMGRAYQFEHDLGKAMSNYQLALQAKSDNICAKIAIGQIEIDRKDYIQAKLTFERIVQEHPKCPEGLLILGSLYAQDVFARNHREDKQTERKKAQALLDRYIRIMKDNTASAEAGPYIALSRLYEKENVERALQSLNSAAEKLRESGDGLSPEILNNIAVFLSQKGQLDTAKSLFQSGLNECEKLGTEPSDELSQMSITISFNLARLSEDLGDIEGAKQSYAKIEEEAPGYVDARIRSCYLDLLQGGPNGPQKMQDLIDNDTANLEVRALFAWYLRRTRQSINKNLNEDIEQRHFKHTLQHFDKHDIYSLTGMGNLFLMSAREQKPANEADAERRRRTYEKAVEFFDKSLQLDGQNAYAAQGVAIALAENRKHAVAATIFGKIRETLKDASVFTNLGHCFCELKQYARAIESYDNALRIEGSNTIAILVCLGKAWQLRGLNERNLSALKTSLDYAQKTGKLAAENLSCKFNIAFVQFQIAELVRRMPENERIVSDIEEAIGGLNEAITSLEQLAKETNPPYPAADIQQRANMGQNTLRRQLERALAQQIEYNKQNEDKMLEAKRHREAEESRLKEEAERKRQDDLAKEAVLAAERRKLQEQAREWSELARQEAEKYEEQVSGKKGRGRRKKGRQDGVILSDDENSDLGENAYKSDDNDEEIAVVSENEEKSGNDDDNNNNDDDSKKKASAARAEKTRKLKRLKRKSSTINHQEEQDYDEKSEDQKSTPDDASSASPSKRRRLVQKNPRKTPLSEEFVQDSSDEGEKSAATAATEGNNDGDEAMEAD